MDRLGTSIYREVTYLNLVTLMNPISPHTHSPASISTIVHIENLHKARALIDRADKISSIRHHLHRNSRP